jgi:hypothetical protein
METKPYNLQSPEQIAKDYGGNKQKIAMAMQMGIIDPTAGTLAGMFIDRMRSAAQTEQTPQQTVAQQTFAPPAPPAPPMGAPAGLGATPQAAAMPPMNATPPMGAAPPQDMPMMAMGGMVPPYASGGGLSDMPLPDGMFDEPSNGGFGDGYAGGGMVAFAGSGLVKDKNKPKGIAALLANPDEVVEADEEVIKSKGTTTDVLDEAAVENTGDIGVSKRKVAPPVVTTLPGTDYAVPSEMYGRSADPFSNFDKLSEMAPRNIKRAEQLQAYLDANLDPETQKTRAKDDFMAAIGMLGAKMASTPGSLLQSFSAGAAEAIPQLSASAKERKAAEREAINTLVAEERTGNKELLDRADAAYDMSKDYGTFAEAMKDRDFKAKLEREGFDVRLLEAKINAGSSVRNALIQAAASRFGTIKGFEAEQLRTGSARTTALGDFLKSPQGLAGITKARKAGMSDADYISSLMGAFGSGETLRYDSKGNPIT